MIGCPTGAGHRGDADIELISLYLAYSILFCVRKSKNVENECALIPGKSGLLGRTALFFCDFFH